MGKRLLCQIAALLLAAPALHAQSAQVPPPSTADLASSPETTPSPEAAISPEPLPPRIWGYTEYLLWWIKPGPLSTPLVTTSTDSPLTALSGNLGQAGTQVLWG